MVPQKTWVAENFWPDLKISEVFLMGLEVSFLGDSCILESKFFPMGIKVPNLPSEVKLFRVYGYRTEVVD